MAVLPREIAQVHSMRADKGPSRTSTIIFLCALNPTTRLANNDPNTLLLLSYNVAIFPGLQLYPTHMLGISQNMVVCVAPTLPYILGYHDHCAFYVASLGKPLLKVNQISGLEFVVHRVLRDDPTSKLALCSA